jgi:tRNA threonylcarbamoyladenosine biosynthesis protein TsaE
LCSIVRDRAKKYHTVINSGTIKVVIIEVNSETAMKQFGARVGSLLHGGELLELVGDVGAGKTTFTKGLAAGMGVAEDVQSPSFTISRVYDTPSDIRLAHYDFYRLQDAGIMADELTEVVADTQTVTIIEWAGVVEGVLPADRLTIQIVSPTETDRHVTLTAEGVISRRLLEQLA